MTESCQQKLKVKCTKVLLDWPMVMLYGMETVAMTENRWKDGSGKVKNGEMGIGVTRKDNTKNEYMRGTEKIAKLGDKLRGKRLRWYGRVKRKEKGYVGKRMMDLAISGKREEGQREDGWIWSEKSWRWLEQGRETKLTESYGEDFRAVATPNREKPKEED